jgi:predicted amidohydrolase
MRAIPLLLSLCVTSALTASDWALWSPRPEAAPASRIEKSGGHAGHEALVLETAAGQHWIGCWQTTLPVEGGAHYRFSAWRKFENIPTPRRSVYARVLWQDENGQPVTWEEPARQGYAKGTIPRAEPEYPLDPAGAENEWAQCQSGLRAPAAAKQAKIELYLQWAANARVTWSDVSLEKIAPPAPRKIKIAAAHLQPQTGKNPADKPPQFAPLIAEAARQKAELIVLPETLTYYGTGKKMHECAEPVPGPSTAYFGELARKHDIHIVAGLIEQDGDAIYNVSALIGPDGKLIGKYRKVTLPRGEIEAGITPGNDYPVFQTRFGKVGMMICYDGFFPEVARALTIRGAEVIAWPVWGCNPMLARARACENHVFIASSTYTDATKHDWMITGIFDHYGDVIAQTNEWGHIAIAEVDLASPAHWNSLGDFKAQIPSHRPPSLKE